MSLTAALRPAGLSFGSTGPTRTTAAVDSSASHPFHRDASYITLTRMLVRFQHLILLTPSPSSSESAVELSPLQKQIQAELWSPFPYHRTKWMHSIENARTLLLQLERAAQNIKVQRAKRDAIQDLAEKRAIIKRLRHRIEEIGREVEAVGPEAWKPPLGDDEGETLLDLLERQKGVGYTSLSQGHVKDDALGRGTPTTLLNEAHTETEASPEKPRDETFRSASVIRRKAGGPSTSAPNATAQTTGFSSAPSTERSLLHSSRVHEDIAASLVGLAAQLKQQTRAFQFALDQDKGLLNRALEGLDRNLSGMEVASKNMAFLKRMSEGEGLLGRIKLYGMIFAMWIIAILLVFVGPKLRF